MAGTTQSERNAAIAAIYMAGGRTRQIADQFGLGKSTVLRVLHSQLGSSRVRQEVERRNREMTREPERCARQSERMKALWRSGEPAGRAAKKAVPEPVENPARTIFIADIVRHVSRAFNVPVQDILSHRRKQSITRVRHAAMYLAKELTAQSYPQIGRKIGNRDHSTVIHACRNCEALIERYPVYRARVKWARRLCLSGEAMRARPFVRDESAEVQPWAQFSAAIPEPKEPPKPPVPWFELGDDELLERAIRRHRAEGKDFLEVYS